MDDGFVTGGVARLIDEYLAEPWSAGLQGEASFDSRKRGASYLFVRSLVDRLGEGVVRRLVRPWMWRDRSSTALLATGPEHWWAEAAWAQGGTSVSAGGPPVSSALSLTSVSSSDCALGDSVGGGDSVSSGEADVPAYLRAVHQVCWRHKRRSNTNNANRRASSESSVATGGAAGGGACGGSSGAGASVPASWTIDFPAECVADFLFFSSIFLFLSRF